MAAPARVLLIAVDNTDDSEKAFVWALQHIHQPGDAIHIVHVIPRLHLAGPYGVPPVDYIPDRNSIEEYYQNVIKDAEKFITERFVSKLPSEGVASPIVHIIKSEVDTDSVGELLCKKVEECDAACMIIARHNRNRLLEFFVGSVTQYCVRNSKRPVVVVR